MADSSSEPRILLDVRYPVEPLEIAHVNFVKFSRLGSDVFMDVGIIDDQRVLAMRGQLGGSVPAFVTHRFGLSVEALKMIKRNVDDIWEKLVAVGFVRPGDSSAEAPSVPETKPSPPSAEVTRE